MAAVGEGSAGAGRPGVPAAGREDHPGEPADGVHRDHASSPSPERRPEEAVSRDTADADGFLVVLASPHEDFRRDLAACVRSRPGAVFVVLHRRMAAPAPVVAVMPRRGRDGHLGPALWLGPLYGADERASLLTWLGCGGPAAAALPAGLRRRMLTGRPPASAGPVEENLDAGRGAGRPAAAPRRGPAPGPRKGRDGQPESA